MREPDFGIVGSRARRLLACNVSIKHALHYTYSIQIRVAETNKKRLRIKDVWRRPHEHFCIIYHSVYFCDRGFCCEEKRERRNSG
jgi:hypothetical protein